MATKYVLDTHSLIWYLEANPRLGTEARRILDDPQSEFLLPVIALAEACWIVEHGRCRMRKVADFLQDLDEDPRIALVPLDRMLVEMSTNLAPILEMHDRQIVATALSLIQTGKEVAIITKDDNIRQSGLVPVAW